MPFPVSGASGNGETVAASIDGQVRSALVKVAGLRAKANSTGDVNSAEAEDAFQSLVSLRSYVEARKATPGLAAAYMRRFPTLESFDPATEWNAALLAIGSFADWFVANWPQKSAAGKPAFSEFNPSTLELQAFTVTLSASPRAQFVARLDAVLAAFTTP
jgi:hypothetical protein